MVYEAFNGSLEPFSAERLIVLRSAERAAVTANAG